MTGSGIRLIVGLGNPGSDYVGTRHNVGFEVIDALESVFKQRGGWENRCRSQVEKVRWARRNLWIMKPQTFMNLSGEAVKCLCRQEQINPEEILVIYDCLDLPVGRLRLRQNGSSGGQKGMESIISLLGSEKINRLRVGIGSLEPQRPDTVDHVLGQFNTIERPIMDQVVKVAVDAVKTAVLKGVATAMNHHNSTVIEAATDLEL